MVEIAKKLTLPNGMVVDLKNELTEESIRNPTPDVPRNIRLYDPNGRFIWQVHSDFDSDGDPYTGVWYEDSILYAYRWDGGEYIIDLETGFATPYRLVK